MLSPGTGSSVVFLYSGVLQREKVLKTHKFNFDVVMKNSSGNVNRLCGYGPMPELRGQNRCEGYRKS